MAAAIGLQAQHTCSSHIARSAPVFFLPNSVDTAAAKIHRAFGSAQTSQACKKNYKPDALLRVTP
jgi:hypothetical protein